MTALKRLDVSGECHGTAFLSRSATQAALDMLCYVALAAGRANRL
jgi:hypothetical protein